MSGSQSSTKRLVDAYKAPGDDAIVESDTIPSKSSLLSDGDDDWDPDRYHIPGRWVYNENRRDSSDSKHSFASSSPPSSKDAHNTSPAYTERSYSSNYWMIQLIERLKKGGARPEKAIEHDKEASDGHGEDSDSEASKHPLLYYSSAEYIARYRNARRPQGVSCHDIIYYLHFNLGDAPWEEDGRRPSKFTIVRSLFQCIAHDEQRWGCKDDIPEYGCSHSLWCREEDPNWTPHGPRKRYARDFYEYWTKFETRKDFAWVRPNFVVRGASKEKKEFARNENKFAQAMSRVEYNHLIKDIVTSTKQYDPRFIAYQFRQTMQRRGLVSVADMQRQHQHAQGQPQLPQPLNRNQRRAQERMRRKATGSGSGTTRAGAGASGETAFWGAFVEEVDEKEEEVEKEKEETRQLVKQEHPNVYDLD